ncbi:PREDICTED: fetuin-B-like [Nanorana parkeri]|uniref:fetuin-B-like n=1 Tax=Nanorana parkeri TaxID=125878 RepID=UPI0008540C79|nr:PREDICTED: fetuin-B-like [Nanorana parkeri]
MERVCALALCMLLSLCSATSPPINPILTPLNCNETKHAELAADLINEDRDKGFLIRPFRTKSVYEQKLENVPGSSLYYIDFEAKETTCSVLSGKKWKDCNDYIPFHEEVTGECKCIMYISKPWRILKILNYNCTLGTVPSRSIVLRCPDCPTIIKDITPKITAKAEHMVEQFNKDSNQTNYFKLDEIERIRTQWMFGQSYFISFTIKETDCLKTQKDVILGNCKSLEDHKAHVGFCSGSAYFTFERKEEYSVSCEIYNPRHNDDHHHHHHKHGACNQRKEGAQVEESKDNAGHSETGAGEAGPGQAGADAPGPQERCELGKGKHCGHHRGHRHHCHPGHHHHHSGHHHHHPDRPHHHHNDHDHRNHSHPHDKAHHHHDHHNHTSAEHGSSSEETTDKQPFKRTKGSVQVYHLDEETPSTPVPTILRLPRPGKHIYEIADFPNEPSSLETCPSPPNSKSS